ncbi:MAG: aroF [Clostridia bacterium]|jgi:chorismate synthase|nr:aroF [Clostridia bacterium]
MLRYLTAGETHGKCLIAIIEGMPSNVYIDIKKINEQLELRQSGYGRGGRMKIEKDSVEILSGVRDRKTLGSPIALKIENKDWENWKHIMGDGEIIRERIVTKPRPGHADLSGSIKYDHQDIRNVLERASARETAIRVAVGSLVRQFIETFGISIMSHIVEIGPVKSSASYTDSNFKENITNSKLRCADPDAEVKMIEYIDEIKRQGDSVGGIFEVVATGLPIGLGSYVHWDRKLDAKIAAGLMSIQAIKGVEIGLGFESARLPGSKVHDEIFYSKEAGYFRKTNHAGGIEGGMSNGEPLVVRAAMKPIPTLYSPLKSVDIITKEPYEASIERSDVCAVPAASIVAEAIVAWEIACSLVEKFGGDSLQEIHNNYRSYLEQIKDK